MWCSRSWVELNIPQTPEIPSVLNLDPVAARNLAALLVRASEEVERMRARYAADPEFAADVAQVEKQMKGKTE